MKIARRFALALAAGAVAGLAGCGGPKTGELTGTVTLKGKPLAEGVVTLFPESGEPVAAFVAAGAYAFPSVNYGNYRIAVSPVLEEQGLGTIDGRPAKPGEVNPNAKAAPKKAVLIPEKYHSADTSGLRTAVDQPKVTHPITLD